MSPIELKLDDPAATERLGFLLARHLRAGDVVALAGNLGAGKSVLARAVITCLCPDEDDIPSPTFTLVQTYEPPSGSPIMHFDLYRLEMPEEALDLGIEDAFIDAICLIEWPQRLGPFLPRTALTIELSAVEGEPDARSVSVAGGARWADLLGVLRNAFPEKG